MGPRRLPSSRYRISSDPESDGDQPQAEGHSPGSGRRGAVNSVSESNVRDSHDRVAVVLRRHVKEWEENYEAYVKAWLPRLRKSMKTKQSLASTPSSSSSRQSPHHLQSGWEHETSPFEGLSATKKNVATKGTEKFKITSIGLNGRAIHLDTIVQTTRYKDDGVRVPPYTFHVQVHSNILSENNKKLNYNPTEIECEDPDWSPDVYEEELTECYTHGVPWDRAKPLEYAELSKQLRPSISRALGELQCTVDDLLRYIIDPDPPSATKKEVRAEADKEKVGPQRDRERWALVLSALPDSTSGAQNLAARVCKAFEAEVGFSMWYFVKDMPHTALSNPKGAPFEFQNYSSLMCRVCFTHLCSAHGEFEEDYEKAVAKNEQIKFEQDNINYRLSVTSEHRQRRPFLNETEAPPMLVRQRSYQFWRKNLALYNRTDSRDTLVNSNREQFYPCNHDGPCDQAACSCYQAGVSCEKTCGCSAGCVRRFTGCNCGRTGRVCFQSSKCSCWQMERECDPDLCGKCGAADVLDPCHRVKDTRAGPKLCKNVSIQRNVPKRLIVGRSRVSGFGLFTGERVKKGEFLGEYRGEILSEPEADRRQILHQHLREYLFVLNKNQQIDSTYAGNKIRFVNNSCRRKNINCFPVPLLCNGVTRMGLFAKRDMDAGEELFFNYGYSEHQVENFKEVVNSPAIASKSAKPTRPGPAKKSVRRTAGGRQSMVATTAAIPTPSKGGNRRVIDDSEDSYSEQDSSESVGRRRRLSALSLESSADGSYNGDGDDADDAEVDEITQSHKSEAAGRDDDYMRTRGREARDRKRKRRAAN